MSYLILVRHGESLWNSENRFTGWQDVDLSEKGRAEARVAGQDFKIFCKANNLEFDLAYCSVLKRAIKTLNIILEEADLDWLPVIKDYRLNERHYGGLTGLNKAETAAQHGDAQVKIWRRSFDTPPPLLDRDDPRHPRFDPKYKNFAENKLPSGESLKDTLARFLPLWTESLLPLLREGKNILIVAHGNSLRALMMHAEGISKEDIMEVNIPTGSPYVMKFDPLGRFESGQYIK